MYIRASTRFELLRTDCANVLLPEDRDEAPQPQQGLVLGDFGRQIVREQARGEEVLDRCLVRTVLDLLQVAVDVHNARHQAGTSEGCAQARRHERGRDEQSVRTQFRSSVEPMHEKYVVPSAKYADLRFEYPFEAEEAAGEVLERTQRFM